ncbi:predicted protein [Naegleria gruberi]|uniref:Predicted protein n=1 Tax=Naegleria gruberi TaxID=5762 RepID=D2W262_NAEGR|nr:uncharacterized protein NAEGRDRAFT_75474 [Naegleria gruberi]EFC36766.1 predicted protein [Naegleria gruberi]|eukprot:XP_002669510.1 predicted protein [Naegleria gruberi strain NEG-M]
MTRQETTDFEPKLKKLKLSQPSVSLTNLTFEILANIFVYLDPITDLLPNVMPVSEKFYHALGGRDELQTKFPLYNRIILKRRFPTKRMHCSESFLLRLVNFISRTSTNCQVLKIGEMAEDEFEDRQESDYELSIDFFEQSNKSGCFRNLKKLHVYFTPFFTTELETERNVKILQEWFSNLKDLESLNLKNALPQSVMNTILKECKNLRHLTCSGNNLAQIDANIPILTNLESLAPIQSENDISAFFSKVPNLKKLVFNDYYEVMTFIEIRNNCKLLKEFHFTERFANTDVLHTVMQMNQLERISISEIEWDYDSLFHFVSQFSLKQFKDSYVFSFYLEGQTACLDHLVNYLGACG